MNFIQHDYWSFEEKPNSQTLRIFDMIGLKKGGKAYMGPSPEQLFEANGAIGADISDKMAKFHDISGLGQIMLNSHTALLLFFENLLTLEALTATKEDNDSIITKLFNVRVVIQENPKFAIAYFDSNGSLLAA